MRYVVERIVRYQDETERLVSIVETLEKVSEILTQWSRPTPLVDDHNKEVTVYELGPEVPTERVIVEEPQPPKRVVKYQITPERNLRRGRA